MKSSDEDTTIGELAGRFGLAPHVLRHWESVGVLTPARRVGGRRIYGPDQVSRVAVILLGKDVGFGLDQMRRILDAPDHETRRAQIKDHHQELEKRIAQARTAQEMLEHALQCDHDDFTTCPNFQRALADRMP